MDTISPFISALKAEYGSSRSSGLLLGNIEGLWLLDLSPESPSIVVIIRQLAHSSLFKLPLTYAALKSFMEDEVGIFDDEKGIVGFAKHFCAAIKRGLQVDSAWINGSPNLLVVLTFELPVQSAAAPRHRLPAAAPVVNRLEGRLSLALVQAELNNDVYELSRGLHLLSTAAKHTPSEASTFDAEAFNLAQPDPTLPVPDDAPGAAAEAGDEEPAAKTRKRKGKFGGTSLFPTRK